MKGGKSSQEKALKQMGEYSRRSADLSLYAFPPTEG